MEQRELRVLLPDGSLMEVVEQLLRDAGIPVSYQSSRAFKGLLRVDYMAAAVPVVAYKMRPWDMGPVVKDGYAHLAIAADDMLWNSGCVDGRDVVVLDRYPLARAGGALTRLVVAVPEQSEIQKPHDLSGHRLATEYVDGTKRWLEEEGIERVELLGCHGKNEAFRDLGVDAILDNVETGSSLKANGWRIVCEVLQSQTCLFTSLRAMSDPELGSIIESIRLLLRSVIDARCRTMVTCNVTEGNLQRVDDYLQGVIGESQKPTVGALVGGGHAVEVLVMTHDLPMILNELKALGATAIVTSPCNHFVP